MPRVAGQIDVAKSEAILDAAIEVFSERGVAACVDDVARRAGVSKQTIYNHYGSKAELVRAIAGRRVDEVTAPLDMPGALENPLETLAAYGRVLLSGLLSSRTVGVTRVAVLASIDTPEVARALFEAGVMASRQRLAEYLQLEHAAGRLDILDPLQAAQIFAGMVGGPYHFANLLGVESLLGEVDVETVAMEAARRFMRAYAPA